MFVVKAHVQTLTENAEFVKRVMIAQETVPAHLMNTNIWRSEGQRKASHTGITSAKHMQKFIFYIQNVYNPIEYASTFTINLFSWIDIYYLVCWSFALKFSIVKASLLLTKGS